MKIAFLVYDSRSGSTLLSRLMVERLPGVVVTPEIGFESLLTRAARFRGRLDAGAWQAILAAPGYDKNLGVSPAFLRQLARTGSGVGAAEMLQAILREHIDQTLGRSVVPDWVVVKYGRHVLRWREILQSFGANARMIHIVRDPRAVISSKLRTTRPYYRFEKLAWGGSLLAAYRWGAFAKAFREAREAGVATCEVAYERLLDDPDAVLAALGQFLDISPTTCATSTSYQIPASEREIHQFVQDGKLRGSRTTAWEQELSRRDRRTIEAWLQEEILARGYPLNRRRGMASRSLHVAAALPDAVWRAALHVARHCQHRLAAGKEQPARQTPADGDARQDDRKAAA